MKLKFSNKYKKVFLWTMLAVMGIGLLIVPGPRPALSDKDAKKSEVLAEDDTIEAMQRSLAYDDTVGEQVSPLPTATVAPSPTPRPMPVYDLIENTNPDMDALFRDYYAARINHDMDKLKSLSSNPSNVISISYLTQVTEYDEDYRNIKVYTKKTVDEGSYIAYVYYDTKIAGIITLAPNLSKFYIITDKDGSFKISDDEMEADFKEYFDQRNADSDVEKLIDEIYIKMEEAMNKDQDLADFWSGFLASS